MGGWVAAASGIPCVYVCNWVCWTFSVTTKEQILAVWGDADLGDSDLVKDLGTHTKKTPGLWTLKEMKWVGLDFPTHILAHAIEDWMKYFAKFIVKSLQQDDAEAEENSACFLLGNKCSVMMENYSGLSAEGKEVKMQ